MPRNSNRLKLYTPLLVLATCVAASAQAPQTSGVPGGRLGGVASTGPTGTVTGHVYCADTQRPARFADVELLREYAPPQGSPAAATAIPNYQTVARGRTALDGSFLITGVPPGDLYAVATVTGYISRLSFARVTQQPLTGAPLVHVDANRSADTTVSISRGAVVTGRVTYDDGTPVAGVPVRLRNVVASGSSDRGGGFFFGMGEGSSITDDRGNFRIAGLAPGKYLDSITVQTESTGGGGGRDGGRGRSAMISVFAPNTQRRTEARILDIRGSETIDGADIVVALAGLHSVKGSVESKADAHLLNSGSVLLKDAADASFTRTGFVDSDGTFFFEYLPPGNYTLAVTGSDRAGGDRGRRGPDTTTISYQPATTSVIVADHDVAVDPVMLAQQTAAK